jgi:biopolymer transport protein ExbD
VPTLDDCYPWQPDGCEWTIRYLWRWMSSFGRLDVIVLALMLVYLFAVVIHVCYRYYLARRLRRIDSAGSKKLAAALNIKVSSLKSIALTAPCLGLAGTCVGILSALGGVGMEKHTAQAMIATRIALALIPTAVGIPVAVLATCFYNYFCTRMDLLEGEVFEEGQERGRHFRRARRFPPKERFAELPAFGLLGALPAFGLLVALGLTVLVKIFMPLSSFRTPTGLYVKLLAHTSPSECGDSNVIVLQLLNDSSFKINSERVPIKNLRGRLRETFQPREERILLVRADAEVSFQEVVAAIGIAESAVSNLYVALLTPESQKEPCLYITRPRELPKLPQ